MICLDNTDSMFTLNNMNVEELYFWSLLEGIVKESVKLLCWSFKIDSILCFQEDVICFNIKGCFLIIVDP